MLTIKDIFDTGTNDVEFLRTVDLRKRKRWLSTVVAFANGSGGFIFFGVEADGNLLGCAKSADLMEFIRNSISATIAPEISYDLFEYPLQNDGKSVIALSVKEGGEKPYYYLGDSIKKVFVRENGQTRFARSTDYRALKPKVSRYSKPE